MIVNRTTVSTVVEPGEERTLVEKCPPGLVAETELATDALRNLVWRRAVADGREVLPPRFGLWTVKWRDEARLTIANESARPWAVCIGIEYYRQEDIDRFFGAIHTTCIVPTSALRALLDALRPDPRDLADYQAKADSIAKHQTRWPGEDWTQDLFNTREDYAEWRAMDRQVELWRLAEPLAECLPKEATPDAPR